jgi:nucleotide-binding universal stress UspA family protein
MYQRILVPIDGSPTATRGLDAAIDLARLSGGAIWILHVLDDLVFATASRWEPHTPATSCRA